MNESNDQRTAGAVWWALIPVSLAAAGLGLLPLRSWDYWWHILMGRHVATVGEVPSTAMFLYTMEAGARSVDQPWLAQWLLYQMHESFGLSGMLLLRNLVVGGVFGGACWMALRRGAAPLWAVLTSIAGLLFAYLFVDVRTQLFVLPMFVGLVGLGLDVQSGRRGPRWLWGFPFAAALWANLHGSFPLVAVLCVIFACEAGWRWWQTRSGEAGGHVIAWLGAGFGVAVAPLLNPHGVGAYAYVWKLSRSEAVRRIVSEWGPTTLAFPSGVGALFYLTVVGLAVVLWTARTTLRPVDPLLGLAFAGLAVTQARGLVWWGLLLPIVMAPYLGREESAEQLAGHDVRAGLALKLGVGVGLAIALLMQPVWPWWGDMAVAYRSVPVRSEGYLRGLVPADTPVEAVERLRADGGSAAARRLFHDEKYAGFLLFHLLEGGEQRRLVFVDQRVQLPPLDTWRDYARVSVGERWREILADYGVGAVLASREEQAALIAELTEAEEWSVEVRSPRWVLFFRRNVEL